jgi:hypothetical protein
MKSGAERDIFTAWIAAVVSGTVTLAWCIFTLADGGEIDSVLVSGFVNAALIYFLAYWVARNSRTAIVVLIAHLLIFKLYTYWSTGGTGALIGLAIFGYFYVRGAIAIFEHHRPRAHEA